ncbi:Protein DJ-1 [Harpegnathos saltator]|uniref:Protein DJ-1 n=2 Tax=Harpegnathos saltator TaxID=610380 RepID=E2C3H8_HARSA|nr:Protein DJ-1 [Harpegnathos saltator]
MPASCRSMLEKSALLVITHGSEEMEAVITADILRRGGVDVTIASLLDDNCVTCSRDVKICADAKFADVSKSQKYDVVILPGGWSGSTAFESSVALGDLLKEQVKEDRVIAAICAAPIALKAHGIGKGKKITSYPSVRSELVGMYDYSEDRVVTDGNLITSRGPATAFDFGLAIVEKLLDKETACMVAKQLLYTNYC